MHPLVKHISEPYDVLIDRSTKWGNPFKIGTKDKNGPWTREIVIELHKAWLPTQPQLMDAVHELRDKKLGCHCAPQACHGDFLADLAAMRVFYFTLSASHIEHHWPGRRLPGGHVRVHAPDMDTARTKMFEVFGRKWSFPYENREDFDPWDQIVLFRIVTNSNLNISVLA